MGKGVDSVLNGKGYTFAIRIVKLCQFLQKERSEYVISKQVLRSGTSIGASIRESEFWQSKSDFIHKLSIALKEANETEYWISLLYDTEYIDKSQYTSIQADCNELISLLVASIKTLKANLHS
jgi:four helix bundle protein